MPRIQKKDAKATVEVWRALFTTQGLLNTFVTVCFGTFNWPGIVITDIAILNTTGMVNAPTKRQDGENYYTPVIIQLNTFDAVNDEGGLRFVVEDTKITAIVNGVRLITPALHIDIRK